MLFRRPLVAKVAVQVLAQLLAHAQGIGVHVLCLLPLPFVEHDSEVSVLSNSHSLACSCWRIKRQVGTKTIGKGNAEIYDTSTASISCKACYPFVHMVM